MQLKLMALGIGALSLSSMASGCGQAPGAAESLGQVEGCGSATAAEVEAARLASGDPAEEPAEANSMLAPGQENEWGAAAATTVFPFATAKHHGLTVLKNGSQTAAPCYSDASAGNSCLFPSTKYITFDTSALPAGTLKTRIVSALGQSLTGTGFTNSPFGTPNIKFVPYNSNEPFYARALCTTFTSFQVAMVNGNGRMARTCSKWTIQVQTSKITDTSQSNINWLVKHEVGHTLGWGHFNYGVMGPYVVPTLNYGSEQLNAMSKFTHGSGPHQLFTPAVPYTTP